MTGRLRRGEKLDLGTCRHLRVEVPGLICTTSARVGATMRLYLARRGAAIVPNFLKLRTQRSSVFES